MKKKPASLEEKIERVILNHNRQTGIKISEVNARLHRPVGFAQQESYEINYFTK